jgi:putative FmdB family regulatory protein
MPRYEYRCEKCNENFLVKMSMEEHDTGKVACPACQESRIVPHYASFFAKTSKKS